jgi:periplasmic glucans biosynthesis protein
MAPLTSMFWYGENSERKFDDYRPEVHDSDGLLMHLEGGERCGGPGQRPGVAPPIFPANNIRGFGLLQRDRKFEHYQDLFHSYENVPSVWVAPQGQLGRRGKSIWSN